MTFLNCSTCDKAVKSNNSILCFICEKWTHQNCSGLSKAEINQIEKTTDTWMCKTCKCDVFPFPLLTQVQLQSLFNSDSCLEPKTKNVTTKRRKLKLKPKWRRQFLVSHFRRFDSPTHIKPWNFSVYYTACQSELLN